MTTMLDERDPAKIETPEELCGADPEFHGLDEQRMGVAQDRLALSVLLDAAQARTTVFRQRAARLAQRDERNGYVEMFRLALGATR